MFAKDAGWRIKQMRKLLGISRKEMARECGTSAHTIKRIEHGQQMMTAELLARICMALGVSADYVLGLAD
jgi:transcriptional regulator with XRE-family HTH domain